MSKVQEALESVKTSLGHLTEKIERSAAFEKVVLSYEGMEPRKQEWARFALKVFVLGLLAFLITKPLLSIYKKRSEMNALYSLLSDIEQFNLEMRDKRQGYKAPPGWTPIGASTKTELKDSLSSLFGQIGIPEDFYDIQNGMESLDVKITELSLRQLQAITFQIDGFYPKIVFSQYQIRVHPENKELLQMDASIVLKGGISAAMPSDNFANEVFEEDAPAREAPEARSPPPRRSAPQARVPPPVRNRPNDSNRQDESISPPMPPDINPNSDDSMDGFQIPDGGDMGGGIDDEFLPPDLELPPDIIEER